MFIVNGCCVRLGLCWIVVTVEYAAGGNLFMCEELQSEQSDYVDMDSNILTIDIFLNKKKMLIEFSIISNIPSNSLIMTHANVTSYYLFTLQLGDVSLQC